MSAACPMCHGAPADVPCQCVVGDVRRGMLLLLVGWGGDHRDFRRDGHGWRLGDGLIASPWLGPTAGQIPEDPWMALEQIEADYRVELSMLLFAMRQRIGKKALP